MNQSSSLRKSEGEDLTKFWPVFGRENDQKKQTSFWSKGETIEVDSLDDEPDFEGLLSRIGRKEKLVKNYYYKLFGNFLVYYINENDNEYKGYIKLNKDVLLEKKQLKGNNEFYYYLEFSKDSNMRKLYSK